MSGFDWSSSNVKELAIQNFDQNGYLKSTGNNDKSVVLFYASWCGPCNNFKADYMKLSKNGKANFYAIESEKFKNKNESWKYKIQGFPTVVGFFKGQPYSVYNGNRSVEDLTNYVNGIGKNWNM